MAIPIIGWAVGALVAAAAAAGYKMWSDNEDSSNSNENKKYEYVAKKTQLSEPPPKAW